MVNFNLDAIKEAVLSTFNPFVHQPVPSTELEVWKEKGETNSCLDALRRCQDSTAGLRDFSSTQLSQCHMEKQQCHEKHDKLSDTLWSQQAEELKDRKKEEGDSSKNKVDAAVAEVKKTNCEAKVAELEKLAIAKDEAHAAALKKVQEEHKLQLEQHKTDLLACKRDNGKWSDSHNLWVVSLVASLFLVILYLWFSRQPQAAVVRSTRSRLGAVVKKAQDEEDDSEFDAVQHGGRFHAAE